MKNIILPLLIMLLASTASAQDNSSDAYPNPQAIPDVLKRHLGNGGVLFPERYINQMLNVIRDQGRTGTQIDKEDISLISDKRKKAQQRQQVQQVLAYDQNLDAQVTSAEIMEALNDRNVGSRRSQERQKKQFDREVEQLMRMDKDKDGVITLKEMTNIEEKRERVDDARLEDLLELDPNGDGVLTVAELETLSHKAFNTVDLDHDGIISSEESEALRAIYEEARRLERSLPSKMCIFDRKPLVDEKIVFAAVYEGKTVSTVSVADQTEETNVIPVEIDKGDQKIYLVASSFSPVIWQITGDVNRVAHAFVAGPSMPPGTSNNDMGSDKVNAGIVGLSSDKVTFKHARQCGMGSAYSEEADKKSLTQAALQKLFGRKPDMQHAEYRLTGLHVTGTTINTDNSAALEALQVKAPEGFDPGLWNEHLRFMPGGVIKLDPKSIVSDAPAVSYKVLPKGAGLSKLYAEGAIESLQGNRQAFVVRKKDGSSTVIEGVESITTDREVVLVSGSNGFKIVKNIPYYPAGLHGGYSTKFTIAKGVIPPQGDAGHSCVTSEEDGKTLSGSCR